MFGGLSECRALLYSMGHVGVLESVSKMLHSGHVRLF
ncbi:hypothetical protein F383_30078 [Gossypium arboreum]|uniref:Uncharacterized protein n=1 Tax=Gossypium arboreum TaxID=29729 RepID=A0A0B0MX03_GOSAR|nr:hypothetical protein F383_30078 [Gossypium arboreum]